MKRLQQKREGVLIVGFVLALLFLHSLHLPGSAYHAWLIMVVLATYGLLYISQ